jgi:hypothetical protein
VLSKYIVNKKLERYPTGSCLRHRGRVGGEQDILAPAFQDLIKNYGSKCSI